MTTYQLADPITPEVAKELAHLEPHVQQLLFRRGVHTKKDADQFLSPNYETDLHDPALLHDIDAAVERILATMKANEQIVVFSDYDCDGIPGGVIGYDFFTAIGYEQFSNYIPHRHYEGFGLSVEAVEKLAKEGAKLIITIDCGVTDVEAVARANELGVAVIITDHHEPAAKLPEAVAVVNPKLGEYPFPDLCGAAVFFKLVQAVLTKGDFDVKPGWEKWWLDMVGVATIADMVPLVGENRTLAHYGITVLRKSRRPGLQQLLKKAKASQQHLTEDDIGFTLGPRINAASRMDTPEDAFYMLATRDEGEAGARVDHLEKLNQTRKTTVAQMTKEIHKRVNDLTEIPDVIVMGNVEWRPALVGLAANKLAEEHSRPVFLWGRDGNGAIKGSARAGGEVSVVKLMEAAADLFLEYGGHHASGGFTVKEEHTFTFGDELNQVYKAHGNDVVETHVETIDSHHSIHEPLTVLLKAQQQLAPYGVGNPKPLYGFKGVTPAQVEQFGKTKEHLKLLFETDSGKVEAIAFFATAASFTKTAKVGEKLTLLAHLEQSFFMGRLQTRLRIVDIQ
ncbi:MAG: single-stranded-DNA-specific exonuclease RecJ [Patescibacteria group bacterium]